MKYPKYTLWILHTHTKKIAFKKATSCLLDSDKMVNYNSVICSGGVTVAAGDLKSPDLNSRVGSSPTLSTAEILLIRAP